MVRRSSTILHGDRWRTVSESACALSLKKGPNLSSSSSFARRRKVSYFSSSFCFLNRLPGAICAQTALREKSGSEQGCTQGSGQKRLPSAVCAQAAV